MASRSAGIAAAVLAEQAASHPREIGRQLGALNDRVVERDERGLILRFQTGQQLTGRLPEVIEALTDDAVAHVENQHQVQRDFFEAREIDLLRHAVVDDLEVVRRQPAHWPAPAGAGRPRRPTCAGAEHRDRAGDEAAGACSHGAGISLRCRAAATAASHGVSARSTMTRHLPPGPIRCIRVV